MSEKEHRIRNDQIASLEDMPTLLASMPDLNRVEYSTKYFDVHNLDVNNIKASDTNYEKSSTKIWDQHHNLSKNGEIRQNSLLESDVLEAENHLFNGTVGSDIKSENTMHQRVWETFEPDEDHLINTKTDQFTVHNSELSITEFRDHNVINQTSKHSKSEYNNSKMRVESTIHKRTYNAESNNINPNIIYEGSQFSTSKPTFGLNNHKDLGSSNRERNTSDGQKFKENIEAEVHDVHLDSISDQGLIINATSLMNHTGRSGAHMFSNNNGYDRSSDLYISYSSSYAELEQSTVSMSSSHTKDASSPILHIPNGTSSIPHSVETSISQGALIYDYRDNQLINENGTARTKRKQFNKTTGSRMVPSGPENSSINESFPDSSKTIQIPDMKKIFRTPSSASVLSDNSMSSISPHVASQGLNKKSNWKSTNPKKKGTLHRGPLDDSMNFEIYQPTFSNKIFQIPNELIIDSKSDDNNIQIQHPTVKTVDNAEVEQDAKQETKTAVYKRRWYLLFLFSMSAMLWNAVWSTWGPIAQSAEDVYGWTDGDIAMFIWLGNIPFLITMFPSAYLMDVKGMRMAMIFACVFMFLGTGFRCIPSDINTASWLIRIGQFLNGMAGTIPNSGPALLSALWFPPNQRASATAISTVAGYMGASISFVIGPLLVPEPNDLSPVNNTDDDLSDDNLLDTSSNNTSSNSSSSSTNTTADYDAQKTGIMNILYVECGIAGLLLLLVLIYFPSKPPLPPSISASIPREKYKEGLKMLIRNKQFWVCALAFSVPIGVYEAWQVILDVNLASTGVSQTTAGWLDFYATVGGCVSGLLVSKFADFFTRQMKLFLLVFYVLSSVAILWFTLVVFDILPFDHVSIYAAIIIAGVFLDGGGPLFFELTIEVSYPVGEGVTSGFTQMLCAAAGIVFLSIVQIQSLGKQWMNWCFFGCVTMAIPLLFFINTTYGRADIDDLENDQSDDEDVKTDNEAIVSKDKAYLGKGSHA